jgi:hypothetical protein
MTDTSRTNEPIDAVYTWVDDSIPGYRDLLARYAAGTHDLNANRTRDNLDLLKYSLRSLARFATWIRHVYIVSCAPQVPAWLSTASGRISVVHHDAFIDAGILPTFNSFAIQSYLHRIPGVSRRFLNFDDDVLLGAPVTLAHFLDPSQRLRVFRRFGHTPDADKRHARKLSPWNASLASTNHLLDSAFGHAARPTFTHAPLLIDVETWEEMIERWPEDFARTRKSRFRARDNVVPDYLYPQFLLATERGVSVPMGRTYREAFYHGLENSVVWTWCGLGARRLLRPKTIGLNDNFGDHPKPAVVAMVRRALERLYPAKSPFEI